LSSLYKPSIALVGGLLLALGLVMLFLPAPGALVIALGLTLLSREFDWAKGLSRRLRELTHDARARMGALLRRSRG
jgi:hypothetical protein